MHEHDSHEEYSFYNLFVPLTNKKALVIIVVVGITVYFNMLFNGFVWDDVTYLITNTQLHQFNLIAAFQNNLFNIQGQYRPLTVIYFSLLYSIFGPTPFIYHFIQLSLHTLCGVLIFKLFRKYFSLILSLFLSLLFVVHPINVESVAYISQTDSPIFLTLGISSLLLVTKKELSFKNLILLYLLLLLSLFTKETGMLFVLMVLIYCFLFKRTKITFHITGAIIISIIYFFFRYSVGQVGSSLRTLIPIDNLTFNQRLFNIPAIIFYYLKTLFFPANLAINQQWLVSSINFSTFYLPLVIDICFFFVIIFLGFYLFKHKRNNFKIYVFFFLWFILGLGLCIQLIPLDATVADRWFYFPLIGFLGMVGSTVSTFNFKKIQFQKTEYTIVLLIILMLSVRTMVRNSNWQNAFTLYSHDIQLNDNEDMENMLGSQYMGMRQYNEAIIHFKKSVRLYPYVFNVYNLANAYEQIGNYSEAEKYYLNIINEKYQIDTLQPVYEKLAEAMLLNDPPQKSTLFIKSAIKKYPNDGILWVYLAAGEYRLHNLQAALSDAKKAKTLFPNSQTESLYNEIKSKY